jgi:hypothetical protein
MFKIFQRQGSNLGDGKMSTTPSKSLVFGVDLETLLDRDAKEGKVPSDDCRPFIYQKLTDYLLQEKGRP